MNLDYNTEQNMLRESVAEFLAKEIPFDRVKEIEDSPEGYDKKSWGKMAKLGWMELYIPETYGGLGDPFFDVSIILEELGKKACPSPFLTTVIQCGEILLQGGSEAQKRDLLPRIGAGDLILSLAQMEKDGSLDESGIMLPASREGERYLLNGTKMFVLDANIADKLIVAARIQDIQGISLFLLDTDTPGITCEKMVSIGKDNNCVVTFDNVEARQADIIGHPGEGWSILESVAPKATIAKCAEMLGGCAESIRMTVEYAKQREQYGTPIGGFQVIQHYLADMKIAFDTGLYYFQKTAWMVDQGEDITKESSILKAYMNKQYKFITERAVQIHGGIGTTREFNIGLFYRRAKASEAFLGDSEHHYKKLADALAL